MCYIAAIHAERYDREQNESLDLLEVLQGHRLYRILIQELENHPHKGEMAFLHSSLIVRGGKVLSVGINSPSQNGFCRHYAAYDQTQLHAEFSCVNKIRRKINLRGCTMYNCRMTRGGKISISKPCESCETMLREYGFKKVVFTTQKGIEVLKLTGRN